MIRLFNVYYPVRTLVLLVGEALIVGLFLRGLAMLLVHDGADSVLRLSNELFIEDGYLKILAVTAIVLLFRTASICTIPTAWATNGI